MPDTIIIVLQGGLGNQLFQYAAGLATAKALGSGTLWLTPAQENKHAARDYRRLFFSRAKAIGPDGGPEEANYHFSQPQDAFAAWNPLQYQGTQHLILKGYFQHLAPIQSWLPLIRADLLLKMGEARVELKHRYGITDTRRAAFLHVRRGDYVGLPEFWKQEETYYTEALAQLRKAAPSLERILVFSDDLEWCRVQAFFQGHLLSFIDEKDEVIALALMSLCQGGAIIANSTFSWWGAILAGAGATRAPVIYPSRWYKDAKPALFLPGWIEVL
jgi:hypothetical protein